MQEYLVSVIITTYNRPFGILNRAIRSVLRQTYSNFELLVIDDNGNNSPVQNEVEKSILQIGDSRICLIKHDKNQGACKARNTGIKNSLGQLLAFLDDDDEWLPEKLFEQVNIFCTNDEIGLVYCRNYIQKDEDRKLISKRILYQGYVYKRLLYRNFIGSTSFVMIKREIILSCGLFDETMKSSQDYEYWLRICKKYKVIGIQKPLVNYYEHTQERISNSVDKKIDGMERLNTLYWSDIVRSNRIRNRREMELAPFYAKRDGKYFGIKYALKLFARYPLSSYSLKIILKIMISYNM